MSAIPNLTTRPLKYASNPVIALGGAGSFYETFVTDPVVMIDPSDSTRLVMWFSAVAAGSYPTVTNSIGRATSTVANPYVWVVTGQVLTASAGDDVDGVRLGDVTYDSGTYHFFYTGFSGGLATFKIRHATSTDGITIGSKTTILTPTGQGRTDGNGTRVDCAAVYQSGSNLTLIYSYYDVISSVIALPGYRYATATTADYTAWTKGGSGDVLTTYPLNGEKHQVFNQDGMFYLIYEAGSFTQAFRIYAAVSGSVTGPFTNISTNPILLESGIPGSIDRYHVATPRLINVGGSDLLFYSPAGAVDQPYNSASNTWPMAVATYTASPSGAGTRRG